MIRKMDGEIEESLEHAIGWMLSSGIQAYVGPYSGGVHAWYDTQSREYSFVYSEVTGYACTFYSHMHAIYRDRVFVKSMQRAADYLTDVAFNDGEGGVLCRVYPSSGKWVNDICTFDNGMCLNGLVNCYKLTAEERYLKRANCLKDTLLTKLARTDGVFYARLKLDSGLFEDSDERWSTQSGPYQAKLALGLLNLHSVTHDALLLEIVRGLCDNALTYQEKCGRFLTSRKDGSTFLHPHCYAIEGLIAAGVYLRQERYLTAAERGIDWVISLQMKDGGFPAYFLDQSPLPLDSCDMDAQVVRIWSLLAKKGYTIGSENGFEKALNRILTYQHLSDEKRSNGGFSIGSGWFPGTTTPAFHVNSWATMMCAQAICIAAEESELSPFLLV